MNDVPTAIIDVQNLTKAFGKFEAVKNISLSVSQGEVYGFLGPNGAGKSTTIRMMMNYLHPTSGQATILGLDVVKDSVAIKRSIGYLSSDMAMYPKMTGWQFLDYMAELQGGVSKKYQRELAKRLQADGSKKLGSMSRGNRQKFAIIQAFMHQPDVLILDEPSSGLDPLMQETFYEFLAESKARGAAVFMSSHIMSEVQKVCDRVGIIREGKLIAERNISEMAQEAAHTIEVTFQGKPPVAAIKKLKGVQVLSADEHDITIHIHGDLPPLLALLSKYPVVQLDARQLDLEELFKHFYKGNT